MVEENGYDQRWKDLMDKLSSIEDLQNLTQLDIINLKNEIEKMRLTSTSPVPPEVEEKIVELEEIAKNVDVFKKWKQTIDEVKFLRSKIISGFPAPPQPPVKTVEKTVVQETPAIGEIRKEMEEIRKEMATHKLPVSQQINIAGLRNAIEDNRKTIEALKSTITERPKTETPAAIPEIGNIRKMINENRRLVDELKLKTQTSAAEVPSEIHQEVDNLHSELMKLETEVREMKLGKPEDEEPRGEIDSLRRELFTKLDQLNTKFGTEYTTGVKNAIEANRTSIEKLKEMVSGRVPEGVTRNVRREMEENRKFMEEIKRVLLVKKPKTKIVLPADPTIRKKMLQIEQKVNSLGRKLEKMNNLKPIKIPEFPPSKTTAKISKDIDIERVKKDIETALSKMNTFVTKEDIEKGLIERRMKTDEKLLKDDLYREMNEIKKAILRNEDHINNLVSDMEQVKKEVSTVEKSEWGKGKKTPDFEDLQHRIDEIERKMKTTQTGLLLIE